MLLSIVNENMGQSEENTQDVPIGEGQTIKLEKFEKKSSIIGIKAYKEYRIGEKE